MIAFESSGSGEPLVLLHGVGTSRAIWRRAMPELAGGRLVIAADLPGFGGSPAPPEGFELETAADALAAGLEGRVQTPFDLLGNSLGGAIATVLAGRRPELVRRLILAAPAGFAPRAASIAVPAGWLGSRTIAVRRLLGAPLAGSPAARRLLFLGAVGNPACLRAEDARAMLLASRGAGSISQAIAAVLSADLRPRIAELGAPVGLIWGDRDRIVPIATARRIRLLVPGAPLETIRGAGHVPQIERPREFADAVRRLLSAL